MSESAIICRNVTKSFGEKQAVADVSFDHTDGKIMGILGPNGSGKTTLLRILMNLLLPDGGEVSVYGRKPSSVRTGTISYLPEERGLYVKHDIWRFFRYYAKLRGISDKDIVRELIRVTELLDIQFPKKGRIGSLSKGNQQKMQLAISMLGRPKLLILDEPFSGLDPENRSTVHSAIQLLADEGTTILIATHMLEQAESLCESVLLMKNGRVVRSGSIASIKKEMSEYCFILGFMEDEVDLSSGLNGWGASILKPVSPYVSRWRISPSNDVSLESVMNHLAENGIHPDMIEREFPSLEEIYMRLTCGGDVNEAS